MPAQAVAKAMRDADATYSTYSTYIVYIPPHAVVFAKNFTFKFESVFQTRTIRTSCAPNEPTSEKQESNCFLKRASQYVLPGDSLESSQKPSSPPST